MWLKTIDLHSGEYFSRITEKIDPIFLSFHAENGV